jgi:c-di-AMP phosphodiesterase-like protein
MGKYTKRAWWKEITVITLSKTNVTELYNCSLQIIFEKESQSSIYSVISPAIPISQKPSSDKNKSCKMTSQCYNINAFPIPMSSVNEQIFIC